MDIACVGKSLLREKSTILSDNDQIGTEVYPHSEASKSILVNASSSNSALCCNVIFSVFQMINWKEN